jgi:signal transduction histidine kinase
MSKLTIKLKLILLFLIIKILPLLVIVYISYIGIENLKRYMNASNVYLYNQSKEIIVNTANESINDSIKNLNKKSQTSLERLTLEIANNISEFLKQRDNDLLFLSSLDINDLVLKNFYTTKVKDISVDSEYFYDDKTKSWNSLDDKKTEEINFEEIKVLDDNKKEFNYINSTKINMTTIPIYKEISFFTLDGIEKYKVSSINKNKLDISIKENTYINSETYFKDIQDLKKNEIYVSEVIGEYVGTKFIGTFTKEKAKKLNIEFNPSKYAYAGKENPKGKKFDGLIRFITPVFKDNIKVGFMAMALDHRHLMEFTDTVNPVGAHSKSKISNPEDGNYAFLFDNIGRNISHVRDYFIGGFDKKTGNRVPPWTSMDVAEKFNKSGIKDLGIFLKTYPTFENQSLSKKANISQLTKSGAISLDCRYLNFAPQCSGWMELTKNGGHGSFIIYWSGVWKLVTAAPIPYYTGKYNNTKRGFGFVTIGANVDEFHAAANETKKNIEKILKTQNKIVQEVSEDNNNEINAYIKKIINELTVISFLMIIIVIAIAIWMSNYISSKIEKLLIGTQKFSNNDLSYRIEVSSSDEIGNLENSFNKMASKMSKLVYEQKQLNEHLEEKVEEKTKELVLINSNLETRISKVVKKNREKDVQLIQHSKMAALGEMISMIIHQWKQPLNAISMINSSAELRILIGDNSEVEIKKDNDLIKKQIEVMTMTMNDFRNFFKNTEKNEYNIYSMIKKTERLIQNIYKYEGIFIKYIIEDKYKELITSGYENEIIQVLINILNNSRDAIIFNNCEQRHIDISLTCDEGDVFISIKDYAGGINDKIKNNIFDAYFTTKKEDKGTGLGLYMVKTIIEKVNGIISVNNKQTIIDNIEYTGVEFIIKLKKEKNG